MAGTPDISSLANYGGALANYNGQPVVNPLTDRDAAAANQAYADCAAMTATATRAWTLFTAAATTGAMVLVAHNSHWGNGAPVNPVLARTGVGVFTVTYPTTITDALGVLHTVNLRGGWANSRGGAAPYKVDVIPSSANVLTVYIFNASLVASDAVGVNLDVYGI